MSPLPNVRPGERGRSDLAVSLLASGHALTLPVHLVRGAEDGPCLLVVGVVHGEEIFAIDVIARVLRTLDPRSLRGSVVAVPVANPLALASQTRNTPTDMLDLNRQFPGDDMGWLSQRIAARLRELVEGADCLLHLDGGAAERVIHYTFVKRGGPMDTENLRLSRAFGLRTLYAGPQAPGSLTSYAAERGIPCVLAEIGGGPLYADPAYLERATRGVLGVMRALDMLDDASLPPDDQRLLTRRTMLRIGAGGIFHPAVGLGAIDASIPGGTELGTVLDPFGLEVAETLEAPYERSVLLQMRVVPTVVQPGDYAFIVADLDSAIVT